MNYLRTSMVLCACLAAGCSRTSSETAPAQPAASASAAAAAKAPEAPAASAPAAAGEPSPPADKPASPEPAVAKPASPGAAAPASAKTFACGSKGQPACPAQAWMKANMASAVASEDAVALAKGLDYIAAHGPAEMPNWASI